MEKVAVDSEDSDGDESMMSSRVAVSRAECDALKDSKRLGMTPQRITALNTSCYGGLMVGEDEVEGVPYGSDPQTLELAEAALLRSQFPHSWKRSVDTTRSSRLKLSSRVSRRDESKLARAQCSDSSAMYACRPPLHTLHAPP